MVKEIDPDNNEPAIDFTAIKSGFEPLDKLLSEGVSRESWSTIKPISSVPRSTLSALRMKEITEGMGKIWGK